MNKDYRNNDDSINLEHVTDFRAWVKENYGGKIDADYLLEQLAKQAVTIIPKPVTDGNSVNNNSSDPTPTDEAPGDTKAGDSDDLLIVELPHKRFHHYVDGELYEEYKAKEAIVPPDHPDGEPTVAIFYHCDAVPRFPLTGFVNGKTASGPNLFIRHNGDMKGMYRITIPGTSSMEAVYSTFHKKNTSAFTDTVVADLHSVSKQGHVFQSRIDIPMFAWEMAERYEHGQWVVVGRKLKVSPDAEVRVPEQ